MQVSSMLVDSFFIPRKQIEQQQGAKSGLLQHVSDTLVPWATPSASAVMCKYTIVRLLPKCKSPPSSII
jgi:hypothetical protein